MCIVNNDCVNLNGQPSFFYKKHFEYIIIFSWDIEVKFCGTLAYTLRHWEVEIILELYCLPYMNNDLMGSIDRGCWLYMNIAFNFHEILQKGGNLYFCLHVI